MRTVEFGLSDTVTVDSSGLLSGSQATIVGSGPIWKDDSDATYASLVSQMHGPGQPQFGSSASAQIVEDLPSPVNPDLATVFFRLRVAATESDLPYPKVFLVSPGRPGSSEDVYPGTCPLAATTVDVPITSVPANLWTDTTTYTAYVSSAFKTGADGEKFWRIYECHVFVSLPSSDAPPCRMFPRSDGLGVGAGRNFPPPRSHQRSPGNRGVGYY